MKTVPVIAALTRRDETVRHTLVHTGQHYDNAMSQIFLEELGVGAPDVMLSVGSASHPVQTAQVMERIEPVLQELQPDLILVPGDVNSTLAAALVASKLESRVGHIEGSTCALSIAPCPRRSTASSPIRIYEICCLSTLPRRATTWCPRGCRPGGCTPFGNTMIDTLVAMRPRIAEVDAAQRRGLSPSQYLVVTLHRPALVDGPLLGAAVAALDEIAKDMLVVFRSIRARRHR